MKEFVGSLQNAATKTLFMFLENSPISRNSAFRTSFSRRRCLVRSISRAEGTAISLLAGVLVPCNQRNKLSERGAERAVGGCSCCRSAFQ